VLGCLEGEGKACKSAADGDVVKTLSCHGIFYLTWFNAKPFELVPLPFS
jgi:hypothetical protein